MLISFPHSNFNVIILADDLSLWAMGVGELDFNVSTEPLQVQSDFHNAQGERIPHVSFPLESDAPPAAFLVMPTDALMMKGHNRAVLIFPSERRVKTAPSEDISGSLGSGGKAVSPSTASYEVILHQGEAYLVELPVECAVPADSSVSCEHSGVADNMRLLNYCGGWQHSLLVVESF